MRNQKGENNNNWKDAGKHTCLTCSKDFKHYRKTAKYCSWACRPYSSSPENITRLLIVSKKPRKPYRQQKDRKVGKPCMTCGKEFRLPRALAARSKYCSFECYIARAGKKICPNCGTEHSSSRKTCSDKCSKAWAGLKQAGEKSHRWQGGKTSEAMRIRNSSEYAEWRNAVFSRDDYICQICYKRGDKLHADHIKPFAIHPELRFDVGNGRTLCAPCHFLTDTWGYGTRRMQIEARA